MTSFQTEAYENDYKLNVEPYTSNILRVYMTFKPLNDFVEIEAQDLKDMNKEFKRDGLHVVEWGWEPVSQIVNR